jgi:hypothetical protein
MRTVLQGLPWNNQHEDENLERIWFFQPVETIVLAIQPAGKKWHWKVYCDGHIRHIPPPQPIDKPAENLRCENNPFFGRQSGNPRRIARIAVQKKGKAKTRTKLRALISWYKIR